ncbi:hypothetical protein [Rubritalea tangerina]|uniref:hypothetical protein n=1 Tax=Rubritalea tangerina TaxID=430798 RepID=UPI0036218465
MSQSQWWKNLLKRQVKPSLRLLNQHSYFKNIQPPSHNAMAAFLCSIGFVL